MGRPTAYDAALRRRAANNAAHTGLAQKIRDEIADDELTAEEVAQALGEPVKKVQWAIIQICDVTGGLMRVPGSHPVRYTRYRPAQKVESDGIAFAAFRTIGRGYASWPGRGRCR